MSVVGDLVHEAFRWLEEGGFRYVAEDDAQGLYSIFTFERAPIAVLVHWDGRDHVTWTVLARGRHILRWLPGRKLGLGHLGSGVPDADLPLPDPRVDPQPLRNALEWDSQLLRTQGNGLLAGDPAAWANLARLQARSLNEGR